MNKITREVYTRLLEEYPLEVIFDKRGKLKAKRLHDDYLALREARFYDEVFFPKMERAYRLIKQFNIFPGAEWQQTELGYYSSIPAIIPADTEIQDAIAYHFAPEYCDWKVPYFEAIWNNDDWCYEEPEDKEILQLLETIGKKEKLVKDKVTEYGVMRSMF